MRKGQSVEGIVREIHFPDKGIVETAEGICVVKNVLPGQKIKAVVTKVRNGKAEGRLVEVTQPAPIERQCSCGHFGSCGGCTYLTLPYEETLKIKEMQVKKLLEPVLKEQGCAWSFEGIKASPAVYEYRNKMEFTFGDEVKDGPLALGMHKRGSFYDIVSVTDCRIVDGDYRVILTAVKELFSQEKENGVPVTFFHRMRHTGYLRHLLVRKASKTGEILIALVTTSQTAEFDEKLLLKKFCTGMLSLRLSGQIVGILHVKNDSVADTVLNEGTELLYGKDCFYEELLGLKFKISAFSFFQTNSFGAEVLYRTVRDYIAGFLDKMNQSAADKDGCGGGVVFDLYSGTGTITQLMAPVARKVIGVELVEEAVEAARENTELNGLHNCEFIAGDVLKVLDAIEEKPDMIILDPPRDGVHPKALLKIINYGVEHILYISCKPASLARDLPVFLENGYRMEKASAIDQFPWTTGIEVVALLSKAQQ